MSTGERWVLAAILWGGVLIFLLAVVLALAAYGGEGIVR